jgi:hypothetical protein
MRITNGDVSLSPSDLSAYLACRHLTTLELDFDAPHPAADIEKIAANLGAGACRLGYVIVFEECDHQFSKTFAADAEAKNGCRVRFIRGYS